MNAAGSVDLRRGLAVARNLPKPNFAALKKLKPTRKGIAITLLIAVALAMPAWLMVRNSSLVAVEQVRVVGLGGYYDKQARRAVVTAAEQMTTMNVDQQQLSDAAGAYVNVAGIKVDADMPHKLTVYVDVRRPVAAARIGNEMVGLTSAGLILQSSTKPTNLPAIEAAGPLLNDHITDAKALAAVRVLGAAPDVLLREVKSVKWGRNGLMVVLAKGVKLYFGDSAHANAKWRGAAAVLADPVTRGAAYIALRAPGRPAVGGLGAAPTTVKPSALDPTAATATTDPTTAPAPTATAAPQATAPQAAAPQATTATITQPQQAPAAAPQPAPPAGGAAAPGAGQ